MKKNFTKINCFLKKFAPKSKISVQNRKFFLHSKSNKKSLTGAGRLFEQLDQMAERYAKIAAEEDDAKDRAKAAGKKAPAAAGEDEEEFEEEMEFEEEAPAKLLPDVRDPKLWMIKVIAKGEEGVLAMQMMNKIAIEYAKGIDHPIKSVFANTNLKGFLYLEAYKESEVQNFARHFRGIAAWSVNLVPMAEMDKVFDSALRQAKEVETNIRQNDWVRCKVGAFKGDLAKVIEIMPGDR